MSNGAGFGGTALIFNQFLICVLSYAVDWIILSAVFLSKDAITFTDLYLRL